MTLSQNRRQFLGNSVIGGVAAGLAIASRGYARESANDRVVVGVMGLSRGRALAGGFGTQPNVEIRYVCDVDAHRAASCAESVKNEIGAAPKAIGDFRRILDDSEVDALICAAPNHWHAPATILACAAGKHVYVEKPCSHNPREGEMMVAAARKHNRAVQMGTQRRSAPGTIEAIQRLHDGAIGDVYLARCWYNSGRGSVGTGKRAAVPDYLDYDLWQGPAPRRPYIDNRIPYQWHWFWHWGNGELGNNGVHTLDLARWGLAVDFPTHVASNGGRYAFDDDQETPDTHTVSFEFGGQKSISWQGLSCNQHGEKFIEFYGTSGALDLDENGAYTIFDRRNQQVEQKISDSRGDAEHIANFLAAVRGGPTRDLASEIETGHKSTLLCHLGNIAHRIGRSFNCDAKNGAIVNDGEAMEFWEREYEPGWEPKV